MVPATNSAGKGEPKSFAVPAESDFSSATTSLLTILSEMRTVRDSLGPRPSTGELEQAQKALATINKELVHFLEDLLVSKPPPGIEPRHIQGLLAMKEDMYRNSADSKRVPHLAVLEQEDRWRHYDRIILEAEAALLDPASLARASQEVDPPSPVPVDEILSIGRRAAVPPFFSLEAEATSSAARVGPRRTASSPRGADKGVKSILKSSSTTSSSDRSERISALSAALSRSAEEEEARGNGMSNSRIPLGGLSVAFAPTGPAPAAPVAPDFTGIPVDPRLLRIMAKLQREQEKEKAAAKAAKLADDQDESTDLSESGSGASESIPTSPSSAPSSSLVLDVSGPEFQTYPLQYVPETIGQLTSLTELVLANNDLVVLPESLGELTRLVRLDASCNKLAELPASIGQLKFLERLDVHHNYLEELPVTLGSCTALVELHCEFNSLRALPESLGQLTRLSVLTVHLNQLRRLPRTLGRMSALTELDAHFNSLEALPGNIGLLANLTKLNVSANHVELKELPKSIGFLEKLTDLDISENHIKELPDTFVQLTGLKSLKLDGNPLRVPPLSVAQQGIEDIMEYLREHYSKDSQGADDGSGAPRLGRRRSSLRRFFDAFTPGSPVTPQPASVGSIPLDPGFGGASSGGSSYSGRSPLH